MQKRWVIVATAGCAVVFLVLALSLLVLFDKPHFGSLVGSTFLQIIIGSIFLAALAVAVAAVQLRANRTWRWIVLLVWALIALTSPAFGFLFLLPWAVLALMSPLVVISLVDFWRGVRA
jgi:hypothetical protein